jgi:hypothetical protein
MVSSWMLRRVARVRTDVPEEPSASSTRVTRIGELGTTQAATSNRRTEPHGVTSQKTPFFMVTAVKTSNLTYSGMVNNQDGHGIKQTNKLRGPYSASELYQLSDCHLSTKFSAYFCG